MPLNDYQIQLSGQISLKGTYSSESMDSAIAEAKNELRRGEISDIEVAACTRLDPGQAV